jgi:hypothetical protein
METAAMSFRPNETVYCRFTGAAFSVTACDGAVAHLSDGTGRIVGDLTRTPPRPVRRSRLQPGECAYCDENRESFAPSHDASQNCQSGKHPHCTCDTCF